MTEPSHQHTKKFDPARAAVLDDEERLSYVDPVDVLELLDVPAAGIVVDFGAGTGLYTVEIAERRPDTHVIAIDEQPTMLERIRAKPRASRRNIETRLPDVIPARAGSVDRVLGLNVLHELDDVDFRAIASLLRPDGIALMIDWNPGVERPRGPDAKHLYGVEDATALLARFGFAVTRVGDFPYHLAFRCRLRDEVRVSGVSR
jgi:SAM-dependent methyltransferase